MYVDGLHRMFLPNSKLSPKHSPASPNFSRIDAQAVAANNGISPCLTIDG